MAKIRHLALATEDPEATAEFYKTAFDFKEVLRIPDQNSPAQLARGIFLSDGTLNLAVLKFVNHDQLGKGLDYVGLHHFGIVVDDLAQMIEKLKALGCECFMKPDAEHATSYAEFKFRGPDGVVFDLSPHPWPGAKRNDSDPLDR